MAVSQTPTLQTGTPIAAKQLPEPGDIAPAFRLASTSGEPIDPASDLVAGRPLLLLFRVGDALPQGLEALVAQLKATEGRAVLVTGLGETAALDGFEAATDAEGTVRSLFGVAGESRLALIAPNRHIAYLGADAAAAQAALARIAATRATVVMTAHPPVLITPDVLSRAECQKLINIFAMQGRPMSSPAMARCRPAMPTTSRRSRNTAARIASTIGSASRRPTPSSTTA
jgi:hypothetical protein